MLLFAISLPHRPRSLCFPCFLFGLVMNADSTLNCVFSRLRSFQFSVFISVMLLSAILEIGSHLQRDSCRTLESCILALMEINSISLLCPARQRHDFGWHFTCHFIIFMLHASKRMMMRREATVESNNSSLIGSIIAFTC